MIAMKYTALITVLAVLITFFFSARVGKFRGQGVPAPATTGTPEFERAFRVHYNTIEQLVLFIPLLWLATGVIGDVWAAAIGAVWIIGRLLYSSQYIAGTNRVTGMFMTIIPTGILMLVSFWGILRQFL